MLRKRAVVAETPDEFAASVAAFLQMGTYPEIEHPNDDFLLCYATHLGDGRSAARAADLIASLCRESA